MNEGPNDDLGVIPGEAKPPSLVPPLLSGRSLQPMNKKSTGARIAEHRGIVIAVAIFVVVVLAVLGAKLLAERAADSVTSARATELESLLEDSTPRDFLAFNAGVKKPGSLAEQIRNKDGFVNVKAIAESSTIRFQPSGWWSGFTERCIVAVVTEEQVIVTVPKVACVRVDQPGP